MEPAYSLPTLMLMTDADINAFTSCVGTMGCSMETACFNASPLAVANACP